MDVTCLILGLRTSSGLPWVLWKALLFAWPEAPKESTACPGLSESQFWEVGGYRDAVGEGTLPCSVTRLVSFALLCPRASHMTAKLPWHWLHPRLYWVAASVKSQDSTHTIWAESPVQALSNDLLGGFFKICTSVFSLVKLIGGQGWYLWELPLTITCKPVTHTVRAWSLSWFCHSLLLTLSPQVGHYFWHLTNEEMDLSSFIRRSLSNYMLGTHTQEFEAVHNDHLW